jgi:hypothetical protein
VGKVSTQAVSKGSKQGCRPRAIRDKAESFRPRALGLQKVTQIVSKKRQKVALGREQYGYPNRVGSWAKEWLSKVERAESSKPQIGL